MRRLALVLALLLPAAAVGEEGSGYWLGGGGGGGGISAGTVFEPSPSTTDYNMPLCYAAVVSNRSSNGNLEIDLCPAKKGMEVYIIWENATVGHNIVVEPQDAAIGADPADTIGTPEVIGGGDGLTWTAPGTTGSVIHLLSISDNEWRVMGFKGAAAVDNDSGPGENP